MPSGAMTRSIAPASRTRIAGAAIAAAAVALIVVVAIGAFIASTALWTATLVTTSVAPQSPLAQIEAFGASNPPPAVRFPEVHVR
jgi:hypothetical protein